MVRALASHQCVPGSIPGPAVKCGLSLLLVLFSAPRGFSPGPPVFPSPQNPKFPNSNSIWNCQALYHVTHGSSRGGRAEDNGKGERGEDDVFLLRFLPTHITLRFLSRHVHLSPSQSLSVCVVMQSQRKCTSLSLLN